MPAALKLHWASSKPNFGDWLSPAICEYLSRRQIEHETIKKCDLVAVGSLLQRAKESFFSRPINVWGTGFIEAQKQKKSRHYYHATRGRNSAQIILNSDIDCFGDPGLLVDQVFKKNSQKDRLLGVVPHYRDQGDAKIKCLINGQKNSLLINVLDSPENVIREISRCEFIVSTSLHGLIVADSLGIPNCWLQVSDNVRGAGWKFRDYYSVFALDHLIPLKLTSNEIAFEVIRNHIGEYQRPGLDNIKGQLVKSFPFLGGIEL